MKTNFEFYQAAQDNITHAEKEIVSEIINGKTDFNASDSVGTVLAFSEIRANIVKWYPFERNASVLEIGANFGEITGFLCETCNRVVALETSPQKALAIAKRHENKENLEIIAGTLETIPLNNEYDYIILTGTLERAAEWLPGSDSPQEELLKLAFSKLKDNGKIILATDNRFGIQYFNGRKDLDGSYEYRNLSQKRLPRQPMLFSELEINKLLKKAGISQHEIFYIFPNYKMPNLIYRADYNITKEDIGRSFQIYECDEYINFDERELLIQILEQGKQIFDFFVNSYFLEIPKQKSNLDIKYVSFTNYRKKQYQIMTVIKQDEVIKKSVGAGSQRHIQKIAEHLQYIENQGFKNLDVFQDNEIHSVYIKGQKRFDEELQECGGNEFLNKFKIYTDLLYKNAIGYSNIENLDSVKESIRIYDSSKLSTMQFLKYGFVDLIPKNLFYIDGVFNVFDQEWMERYLPVEYLIYRALMNSGLPEDSVQLAKKEYNLNLYEDLFETLEQEFRDRIVDKIMLYGVFNKKTINRQEQSDTLVHYRNLNAIAESKNEVNLKIISQRKEEIEILKKELQNIYNSRSWKIAMKMRKIKNAIFRFKKY